MYSEDKIKEKLHDNQFYFMKNGKRLPYLHTLANKFDLKKIVYTLDEFLEDYLNFKDMKEGKSVLKIMKKGKNITELQTEFDVSSLYKHLKNGFDYNSNTYDGKEELLEYFDIDIDLSKFKVEFRRRHVELFGEKSDLEEFREKYKISHLVLFDSEKNQWHLAFDGLIYGYIKKVLFD